MQELYTSTIRSLFFSKRSINPCSAKLKGYQLLRMSKTCDDKAMVVCRDRLTRDSGERTDYQAQPGRQSHRPSPPNQIFPVEESINCEGNNNTSMRSMYQSCMCEPQKNQCVKILVKEISVKTYRHTYPDVMAQLLSQMKKPPRY